MTTAITRVRPEDCLEDDDRLIEVLTDDGRLYLWDVGAGMIQRRDLARDPWLADSDQFNVWAGAFYGAERAVVTAMRQPVIGVQWLVQAEPVAGGCRWLESVMVVRVSVVLLPGLDEVAVGPLSADGTAVALATGSVVMVMTARERLLLMPGNACTYVVRYPRGPKTRMHDRLGVVCEMWDEPVVGGRWRIVTQEGKTPIVRHYGPITGVRVVGAV